MAKMGRPTADDLRQRQIEDIFEQHADGVPLGTLCAQLGLRSATFRGWMRRDPVLASQWDVVKREYVHSLFDRLAIITMQLAEAEFERDDSSKVQALRAAQDGLKHITARLNSAQYGDTKDKTGGITVIFNTDLPIGPGQLAPKVVDGDFKIVVPLKELPNG